MSRALELARKGNYDALILDSSAAATDVAENLLLERTNVQDDDAGFYVLQEDFGTDVSYDNLDPNIRELPSDAIYFRTNLTARQTISTNTVTTVAYDWVQADYNGNANMAADPNKFTCTVPGLYWLKHNTYQLHTAHNSIMTYYYCYLYMNGSYMNANARTQINHGGSGFNHHMFSGTNSIAQVTWLNEGDYIEPKVYIYKTGGTLYVETGYSGDQEWSSAFSGYLVKRLPI